MGQKLEIENALWVLVIHIMHPHTYFCNINVAWENLCWKLRISLHKGFYLIVFQFSIRFFVRLPILPLWKVHDQRTNTSRTFLPALSLQSSFFFSKTGMSIVKEPMVRNLLWVFVYWRNKRGRHSQIKVHIRLCSTILKKV